MILLITASNRKSYQHLPSPSHCRRNKNIVACCSCFNILKFQKKRLIFINSNFSNKRSVFLALTLPISRFVDNFKAAQNLTCYSHFFLFPTEKRRAERAKKTFAVVIIFFLFVCFFKVDY